MFAAKLLKDYASRFHGLDAVLEIDTALAERALYVRAANQDLAYLIALSFVEQLANGVNNPFAC